MKTVPDGDEAEHTLGKKVEQPATSQRDEWESFIGVHGDLLWRNKRTGQLETRPKVIDWEAINKALHQKDDDGFHFFYYGSW
jgi:hypothetical protein